MLDAAAADDNDKTEIQCENQNFTSSLSAYKYETLGIFNPVLKVKCLLRGKQIDHLLASDILNCVRHEELTISNGNEVISCIVKNRRFSVSPMVLDNLEDRFGDNDRGKFLCFFAKELSIHSQITEGIAVFKHFVNEKQPRLSESNAEVMFDYVYHQARKFHADEDLTKSIEWYQLSRKFLNTDAPIKEVSVTQCLCLCYLNNNNTKEAAIEFGKLSDFGLRDCVCHFLELKLALAEQDEGKALSAWNKLEAFLKDDADDPRNLLCVAMRELVKCSQDENGISVGFVCELLENMASSWLQNGLLRLLSVKLIVQMRMKTGVMSVTVLNRLRGFLIEIRTFLENCKQNPTINIEVESEARWFSKVMWNLAILTDATPIEVHSDITLSLQFLALCSDDDASIIVSRQTAFMFASAASLATAEDASDLNDKKAAYKQMVIEAEACQKSLKKSTIQQLAGMETAMAASFQRLISLYKFTALARLADPLAAYVLDEFLALGNNVVDVPTLEKMAHITQEFGSTYWSVRVSALKTIVFNLWKKSGGVALDERVRVYRSLISTLFERFSVITDTMDCWLVVNDAIEHVLMEPSVVYPEIEVLWIMTKTWNAGIAFWANQKVEEAKVWLLRASRLLTKLPTVGQNYEPKMNWFIESLR